MVILHKKYLTKYLGYSPFIYNFIWFREISGSELDSIILRAKDGVAYDDNALPKSFSFKKLIQKTICVTPDSVSWNNERTTGWMNCSSGVDMIKDIELNLVKENDIYKTGLYIKDIYIQIGFRKNIKTIILLISIISTTISLFFPSIIIYFNIGEKLINIGIISFKNIMITG